MRREHDTGIGGSNDRFPVTRISAIVRTRSEDCEERRGAYETLLATYWKPSYKYIRLKWQQNNEDAKDLTQAFFAKAFEKGYFESFDPSRASFQTFLRTCLDRFVSNQRKFAGRQRRIGDRTAASLDFETAEGEFMAHQIADDMSVEEYFHREWVRSLFSIAVEQLRDRLESNGKSIHFQLFELYDLDDSDQTLSYNLLAERFRLAPTTVTNYLAAARREFRRVVLAILREACASEEEFRREARSLLGIDPQ